MNQSEAAMVGARRTRTILTVAISILFILLVALGIVFVSLIKPDGAPDTSGGDITTFRWVRSMYGFGPAADEQLLAPTSVAIAKNGDILATDQVRARIMVFRPDGTFRRLIHTAGGGTGKGMFIRPESIDVDADGNLYIADTWANKIIVFDENYEYVREWPVEIQARGVYATDGKVYVLDVGKVLVYSDEGKALSSFGMRGPLPGQIDAYQGIIARDGLIYITDSFNKRLQCFDESGTVIWTVPGGAAARPGPGKASVSGGDESASENDPEHRWDLPQDLTFNGDGDLVVVDAFQFQLTVVDPKTGKAKGSYGSFGRADGEMHYPTSLDYDARRKWYAVADTMNNRVQIVQLPDVGGFQMANVWRLLSSPFRYLIAPIILFLLAIAVAVWMARRASLRRNSAQVEPLEDCL